MLVVAACEEQAAQATRAGLKKHLSKFALRRRRQRMQSAAPKQGRLALAKEDNKNDNQAFDNWLLCLPNWAAKWRSKAMLDVFPTPAQLNLWTNGQVSAKCVLCCWDYCNMDHILSVCPSTKHNRGWWHDGVLQVLADYFHHHSCEGVEVLADLPNYETQAQSMGGVAPPEEPSLPQTWLLVCCEETTLLSI